MIPLSVVQFVALSAGLICLLLAVAVWTLLRGAAPAGAVRLWTAGGLLAGAGLVLNAPGPPLAGPELQAAAGGLLLLGLLLHVLALRRHIGVALHAGRVLLLWALAELVLVLALRQPDVRLAAMVANTLIALAAGLFGLQAWAAQRVQQAGSASAALLAGSTSAALLARAQWLLAAALLLRTLMLATGLSQIGSGGRAWDCLLLYAAALVAGLYGALAYAGMVLDDSRAEVSRERREALAESARRAAAEASEAELRVLQAQRDGLSAEREQLLSMLASEIGGPLHAAGQAMRDTSQALQALPAAVAGVAVGRLAQAEAVMAGVRSVLDNTLTAAELLTRETPPQRQAVRLDDLVASAVADLPERQRARVRVQRSSRHDEALLEPGLLRLALRNLLRNALQHGAPQRATADGTPLDDDDGVLLSIDDQLQPPALLLSVADHGPGLPAERLRALNGRGPADTAAQPGLGLRIVRRVAALHGGQLVLAARPGRGLVACLELPRLTVGQARATAAARARRSP